MRTNDIDQQDLEHDLSVHKRSKDSTPTLSMSLRSTCKHTDCDAVSSMDFGRLSPSRNFGRSRHSRSPSIQKQLHHRHQEHSKPAIPKDDISCSEIVISDRLSEKEEHVRVQRQATIIVARKETSVSPLSLVEARTSAYPRLKSRRSYSDYSSGFDASDIEIPKTDYTYARSDTYRSRVTPGRQCFSPIMSRSSIRMHGMKCHNFSLSSSSDSDDNSIYQLEDQNVLLSHSHGSNDTSNLAWLHMDKSLFSLSALKKSMFTSNSAHTIRHGYGLDSDSSDAEEQNIIVKSALAPSVFSQLLRLLYLHKVFAWSVNVVKRLWDFIWKTVYSMISYVLLLDTWILSMISKVGRKNIVKALLPLFLLLLLWLLYGQQLQKESTKALSNLVIAATTSFSSMMASWSLPSWLRTSEAVSSTSEIVQDTYNSSESITWVSLVSSFFSAILSPWWYNASQSSLQEHGSLRMAQSSLDSDKIRSIIQREVSAWMLQLKQGDKSMVKELVTRTELEPMVQDLLHEELATWIQQQKQMQEVVEQLGHRQDQYTVQLTEVGAQVRDLHLQSQNITEELVQLRHQLWSQKSSGDALDIKSAAILKYLQELERNFTQKIQALQDALLSLKKSCQSQDEHLTIAETRMASALFRVINSSGSSMQFSTSRDPCPSQDDVKRIVREALFLYDADKTGLVDYALETAGGTVINTRCSETYPAGTAQFSIFGIPVWYSTNSPRTVIQPEVHPGQCWAFKGTQGYLVIQLSALIRPTAVSLEHIPKSLSPTGTIDSAPKEFSVLGLKHGTDLEGVLLGRYVYDQDGDPLQHFAIHETVPGVYDIIELRIHSNHGNMEYTCLYRFRVHGARV